MSKEARARKERADLMEQRQREKTEYYYWSRQIGSPEFIADPEKGRQILASSRAAYKRLTDIEAKLRGEA